MFNLKLLVIFQYIFCLEYVLSLNISQQDNIRIVSNEDGSITCDRILCPAGRTQKCVVNRDSQKFDNKIIDVTAKCLDGDGGVIMEDRRTDTNQFPSEAVHSVMEVNANGPFYNNGRSIYYSTCGVFYIIIVLARSFSENVFHLLM